MTQNKEQDLTLYYLMKDLYETKFLAIIFLILFFSAGLFYKYFLEGDIIKESVITVEPSYTFQLDYIDEIKKNILSNKEVLDIIAGGQESSLLSGGVLSDYYESMLINVDKKRLINLIFNNLENLNNNYTEFKGVSNNLQIRIANNQVDIFSKKNEDFKDYTYEIIIDYFTVKEIDLYLDTAIDQTTAFLIEEIQKAKKNYITLKDISYVNLKAEENIITKKIENYRFAKLLKLTSMYNQAVELEKTNPTLLKIMNEYFQKITSSFDFNIEDSELSEDVRDNLLNIVAGLVDVELIEVYLKGAGYLDSRVKYFRNLSSDQYAYEEGMDDDFSRLAEIRTSINIITNDKFENHYDRVLVMAKKDFDSKENLTIINNTDKETPNTTLKFLVIISFLGLILGIIFGLLINRIRKESQLA